VREIQTQSAASPVGPYSQAIVSGDRIYVSGQGPLDAETGTIVGETVSEQTAQTLDNAAAILEAADASLDDVVKTTVYLRDADDYDAMNEVYADYFSEPYPARCAVEAADFAADITVEIELVAEA
jgi:reactive intermediate/imine deaminase